MNIRKTIRFKPEQYEELESKALELNMTTSEYIRLRLGFPSKRDYRLLLFHISRIGNNINQLAKAMNIAQKIAKLEKSQLQTALTRLLCIQAELEQLRIDFKAGELSNVNQGK